MVRSLEHLEAIAPLGFSVGVHIRFAAPLFFRSTYPKAWQEQYAAGKYAMRDPLVFWGISKTGAIRWRDVTLPDPFGVMAKAREHGLLYGVVASCGQVTSRTIVGAARDDREFNDNEIDQIATLADALHETMEAPTDISPEMIEALHLVDRGIQGDAAARELGISESAFGARLSSAQDRLGVQTTAEALRMARDFRLI